MTTLIRATNLWGLAELVRDLGHDPGPLLARFGIRVGVEHEEDAFVPFEGFVRLLEATASELDCPDLGLRLSQWQGLDVLGPLAVMARNAQTVHEGFAVIARYLHVHSPALRLTESEASKRTDLRFSFEVTSRFEIPQGFELSMANGSRMVRMLGGLDVRPSLVCFRHEQLGSSAAYEEALGCPVRFGQSWCGFELPRRLASTRIDNADPETQRLARRYLETQYLPVDTPLSEHVALLARRMLPTGQCTAEAIADQLALHVRTLQRQLALEGLTCQELVEEVRREQAARYLAEPGFPFAQIAGLLGYSEQSVLNRSCRRWFGMTPGEVRRSVTRAS